jgi:hypothetical protein
MVSRGTTQQSSAPFNRRIVLDVIRRQGTISRKEIVDLVSLSPQTVANSTNDTGTCVNSNQQDRRGLWLADYVGAFLTAGGNAVYNFHYLPLEMQPGHNGSPGTFGFFFRPTRPCSPNSRWPSSSPVS